MIKKITIAQINGNPATTTTANYASTEGSDEGDKTVEYYKKLSNISNISKHNILIEMVDFNVLLSKDKV